MCLSLFLHLYQPPTQFAKVLKSITEASYRRLLNSIQKYPSAKLTLNVSGSLTEQLVKEGLEDVVAEFAKLSRSGQVELVGSAAYHPLLTEIPKDEIRRQVLLNNEINRKYFGDAYHPRGFFPPEMAINHQVLEVVAELGFEWVIVDESAVVGKTLETGKWKLEKKLEARSWKNQASIRHWRIQHHFKLRDSSLQLLIRNADLSIKVAFSQIRTVEELVSEIKLAPFDSLRSLKVASNDFVVLAMDGETFGHHRPEQLAFLEELCQVAQKNSEKLRGSEKSENQRIRMATLSELKDFLPQPVEVEIKTSSWGPWERWKNPKNPIHRLQWKLFRLAIEAVRESRYSSENSENSENQIVGKSEYQKIRNSNSSDSSDSLIHRGTDALSYSEFSESQQWLKARELLDKALHSDQFWWASARPCWHYQMVERGARMLRGVVLAVPDVSESDKKQAKELYDKIIETGLKLYGRCVIE